MAVVDHHALDLNECDGECFFIGCFKVHTNCAMLNLPCVSPAGTGGIGATPLPAARPAPGPALTFPIGTLGNPRIATIQSKL